ncbi:gamma-glutamylcyclotransferase [Neobacillus sp. D3-1R]|uniref:gamma-glutamylcyclotransferase n=1 Tax=Neobacillus sp. D3-1R TaxID=3445778 RepID=UPI003FA036E4
MVVEKLLVFVYGTLRKYERNHGLLKTAKIISEQAWTQGELFDTGRGYPMMKPSENEKVYGELYEVSSSQLSSLDALEDYQVGRKNNLYERVTQMIYTDLGTFEAYVYISEEVDHQHRIPYGDWKVYQFTKEKPEKVFYFAYGSCMDVERFEKAGVNRFFEEVVGAATLQNYSMKYLFTTHDGGRADIVEDGGITEGILYECPYEAVEYLFTREGYYTGWYRATFVDVYIDGKCYPDVLTFHVYEKKDEVAPPEHYATEILRGSRNRVSENYYGTLIKQLENLKVSFDLSNWK